MGGEQHAEHVVHHVLIGQPQRPNMPSATFVKTVNVPGRYGDGRGGLGLSLLVRNAMRGGNTKCVARDRLSQRPGWLLPLNAHNLAHTRSTHTTGLLSTKFLPPASTGPTMPANCQNRSSPRLSSDAGNCDPEPWPPPPFKTMGSSRQRQQPRLTNRETIQAHRRNPARRWPSKRAMMDRSMPRLTKTGGAQKALQTFH